MMRDKFQIGRCYIDTDRTIIEITKSYLDRVSPRLTYHLFIVKKEGKDPSHRSKRYPIRLYRYTKIGKRLKPISQNGRLRFRGKGTTRLNRTWLFAVFWWTYSINRL